MTVPKTGSGQFLFFAAAEFVSFFIIVANSRSIAQGNYLWTGVTDTFFNLQAFVIMKLAIEDPNGRTWAAGLGATVGGTIGSLVSIWVTKHWLLGQ